MTRTVTLTAAAMGVLAMAALSLLSAPPARGDDDAARLLAALAVGYLTYEALDDDYGRCYGPGCTPRAYYYPRERPYYTYPQPYSYYHRPEPPRYYPRYVAPEIDLHRYRFGYPPSQIDPYRPYYGPGSHWYGNRELEGKRLPRYR